MQRRDVVKGLSIVAGGALCARPGWSILEASQNNAKPADLAMPIRGLVRRGDALRQPIQVTVEHTGPDAAAITRLDRQEVDHRTLSVGAHTSMSTQPR
jgi:alpha-mannosidase